jgi:transcriptional regulator with XRE-family HTH domain
VYVRLDYCCDMEDNVKIFIAGAKKVAKIKGFTQKDIAKGVKNYVPGFKGSQATISSYFVGRTRPKQTMMQAMANFFKMSFEEIMEIGRKELEPQQTELTGKDLKKIFSENIWKEALEQIVEKKISESSKITSFKDKINAPHHELVDDFEQPELAYELNCLLREIEKKKRSRLKKIKQILLAELEELREEDLPNQEKKSKTASGE